MNKYSKVCIVNSLYSLLIYLLIINEEEYKRTFFFLVSPIPKHIAKHFDHYEYFTKPRTAIGKILFLIKMRLVKSFKYPFVADAQIYGKDNLQLASILLGKDKRMTVLEDGLLNYTLRKYRTKANLKKMIGGPLMGEEAFGYSKYVDKILLTGLAPIPKLIEEKVEVVDLHAHWHESTESYKRHILDLYNCTKQFEESCRKCDSILLTQPLSEDGVITEEEKLEIYRNMVGDRLVIIKPHPREITHYQSHFPQCQVVESAVPIELLSLLGFEPRHVYTVFSTAALSFSKSSEIHFAGTCVHPSIVRRYGDVRLVDGEIVRLDTSSSNPVNS